MTVVFATYPSIEMVAKAQTKLVLMDIDLIVCDKAHRRTGDTLAGVDQSHFVEVHDAA